MTEVPWQLKKYVFKKGISGNPKGKPRGSLKEFARKYIKGLNPDDKRKFLNSLPTDFVWRMSEGNPKQDTDITSGGKPIPLLNYVRNNDGDTEDTKADKEDKSSSGGNVSK